MQKKNVFLMVLIFMISCVLIGTPVAAITTTLHLVKYANDGTTVLNETTVDFAWMEAHLPVYGDGITHYYHEGPNFTQSWVVNEDDPAILTKDMGAVKGSNLQDICDLVGGMSADDMNVTLLASDGFHQRFAYSSIYSPPARAGPIVIAWFQNGNYVNGTYTDGMRNVMFADTSVNPWGYHVFGLNDMHEAYPSEFWYYYSGDPATPSTTGLSVKNINRVYIYSNESPPPAVTGIAPTRGPLAGNTIITITGTGLTGATAVKFGETTNTTPLTMVSATKIIVKSPAHAAGIVDVRVMTPGGISAVVSGDKFTYTPSPIVTSISPTKGLLTAGTLVTITGYQFTGATAVRFGTAPGTGRTVVSDTKITVKAPAHIAGTVDVTVTTLYGTSAIVAGDKFTYAVRPNITSITPKSGPLTGNTVVTITGTGFTGTTAVKFGTTKNITPLTVVSASRITVKSPAHAAGVTHVTVNTPGGTSATSTADLFTYAVRPNVTALSPPSGPRTGDTRVTVTGTGFTGATAVKFGTTAGTGLTVNSSTKITVTSPAHAAVNVDIRVTTPGGTSVVAVADRFMYT